MLAPYGYAVTDADLAACVGFPYARTHAYLAERVALPDAEALLAGCSQAGCSR